MDGDRCWDAHPFQVTEQTKETVLENITFLLGRFIRCPAYENLIFCRVMHRRQIMDRILSAVDTSLCTVKKVSLVCGAETLRQRLQKDIGRGIRTPDAVARSQERLPLYAGLDTVKIGTDGKTATEIAEELMAL